MSAFHEQRFPILHQASRLKWTSENQADCECPAHEDQKNSLHVTIEGNRLLLRCLAGCDVPSIIRGWGENRYSVLFAQNDHDATNNGSNGNGKQKSKIVATYDYTDASGNLIHQTVRFEPKSFRQRRPAAEGSTAGRAKAKSDKDGKWWLWTLNGIDPVLYRLPEIKQRPSEPVYLVEGEKDADNLAAAFNVLATTNPMGAAKWRKSYSQQLKGRTVYLIPDVDKPREDGSNPGLQHVQTVARALHDIAAEVRIIDLPPLGLTPKWDISDWIKKGGSLELLTEAAANAKPFDPDENETDDEKNCLITNGDPELDIIRPLSMVEIIRRIRKRTGSWPRRVGGALFAHEDDQILWFERPAAMFGWMGAVTGESPKFWRQVGCHTKDEVFARLQQSAQNYESVESLPHEPTIESCYYTHGELHPTENMTALRGFISKFTPATDADFDLLICFFATLFWGGPSGSRPAFILTSDAGRGAGKSTLAHLAADLAGGAIELSSNEDAAVIRQRLLSPEGLESRVALLDNIKSLKFSWAELESLITSKVISGKRLYVGEGKRMNRLTWIMTLNGVSLSTDMAQRSVIIKLDRPQHSGNWEEDTRNYLTEHRQQIVADLIELLRNGTRQSMIRHTRWGRWERDVLSLCGNPDLVHDIIIERQAESDAEHSESELIEQHFRDSIANCGYDAESVCLSIPSAVAAEWLNAALGERHSKIAACRILTQRITEQTLKSISRNRDTGARGYVWTGSQANSLTQKQPLIQTRERDF